MSENNNKKKDNASIISKTNFKYLMVGVCFVQILDTYCTLVPGAILSSIAAEFLGGYETNVQNSIMALAGAISSVGMYFLFFNQYLADKIRRKKMLAITIFGMTFAALGMFLAPSYPIYVFFSFLTGFFVASDIWLIYVNEDAKPTSRALYTNIALMFGLIGAISMVIARFTFITETSANWRGMMLIPMIVGFPLAIIIFLTFKETSKYQLMKADPSKVPKRTFKEDISSIFKTENRKPYLILLLITFIRGVSSLFLGLFEKYISDVGVIPQSQITIIFFMTVFTVLIAYGVNGFLSDRIGRKPLLCFWSILAPISCIIWVIGANSPQHAFVIVFIGYAISHISFWGSLGMVRLINIELLPTDRRATGIGFRSLSGAIGATTGLLLSSVVILFVGLGITFIIFVCGYFLIVPLTYFFLKETKGVELATIK